MADIRIKDLTTEAPASLTGDFLPIDGGTGTRKLSAFNPTFGGNATVGGTLTVTGLATATSGVQINGGSFAAGKIYHDATSGLVVAAKAGSTNDFLLTDPTGALTVLANPTGTANIICGGTFKTNSTTASTSTSSGALVVSGGVGVAKELYVGSATESTSNTTGGLVVSGGLGLALNLNMGGRLFINNTGASNGTLSAAGMVATFGADNLAFGVKGFPSATAGSRYIQLAAGDSGDYREIRINDLGGNVLLGGATSTVKIGGSFQVGNAYVAGAPTATGYIVIKDSTGTSYKIPAVAL